MKKVIKNFLPAAEAIQRLLYPYAEVIVHDVKQNKIVAIYNPFSKRRAGDASQLDQDDLQLLNDCVGPYEKTNWNGNKIKSVSSMIRDENHNVVGMLCINLDVSVMEKFNESLQQFLQCAQLIAKPEPLFKDDWQERVNTYINHYLNEHQLLLDSLNRKEKQALIDHLYTIGAFSGKNAAQYIAQILNVSRATIYNYLHRSEGEK
ncbi:helix-turn-helix transcriptional regulator [Legionella tucsonensis]|uniref:YheO-like PAS domain protein n=1 Tax=Legionella tucsonensis TaxID=40335 RepID=A0A0W0ZUR9_9GAMM|nr:PAS domain-containing protein [Legionella tucsonensis]KTD72499.1 YheO-like PAS domain protein [Legionella tucsonensis]